MTVAISTTTNTTAEQRNNMTWPNSTLKSRITGAAAACLLASPALSHHVADSTPETSAGHLLDMLAHTSFGMQLVLLATGAAMLIVLVSVRRDGRAQYGTPAATVSGSASDSGSASGRDRKLEHAERIGAGQIEEAGW